MGYKENIDRFVKVDIINPKQQEDGPFKVIDRFLGKDEEGRIFNIFLGTKLPICLSDQVYLRFARVFTETKPDSKTGENKTLAEYDIWDITSDLTLRGISLCGQGKAIYFGSPENCLLN